MTQVDVIARAIDWLDACKANDWRRVAEQYAPHATAVIPAASPREPSNVLTGIAQVTSYWIGFFDRDKRAAFELVELYPGHDSVVLVYYDEACQRVSEFLQFDDAGQIARSARHVIPQRRQVLAAGPAPNLDDKDQKEKAILHCEARQSLGEARRLPVGVARNALRQRAVALRALARRGDHSVRQP